MLPLGNVVYKSRTRCSEFPSIQRLIPALQTDRNVSAQYSMSMCVCSFHSLCPAHSLPCWNSVVLWRLRPFVAPSSHFQTLLANRGWTVSTTPLSDPLLFSNHHPPPCLSLSLVCLLWDGTGVPCGCEIIPLLIRRGKGPRDRAVNSIRRAVCSIKHP